MNLKYLSDQALLENTREAAKNERHATTVILHHLLEVNNRRLFSPKYSSLHEYCVKDLKYGDGAAQTRINAMWVLKAVPEVDEKIDSGSLNLTTLSQAQVFFRQEAKIEKVAPEQKRELLSALEGKSTRQVDRELIGRATEPVRLKKRDRVRVVSDTLSELKCLVKDGTLQDLEKLRGLLAHKHPDLSLGELLEVIAKVALQALDPAKEPKRKAQPRRDSRDAKQAPVSLPVKAPAPVSPVMTPNRYIPAQTKREVWRIAHGKCQSCGSFHRLQIDHIQPHALRGSNEPANLRLLCFHCNQREGDLKLGRDKMEKMRISGGISAPPATVLADLTPQQ